ncbi:MAG TPA: penicillin-binding protein activator [Steroidobacteraceae bacterium]|nr:penicillin-binding protein activator [Steroidobacteraceae bacterium]
MTRRPTPNTALAAALPLPGLLAGCACVALLASCASAPPPVAPGEGEPGGGRGAPQTRPAQQAPPPVSSTRVPLITPPTGAPARLALLLPDTGRQAAAAAAVRDGFLAGYYSTPAADRPPLRLYDTTAMSVAQAVARATQDGATFIVGPLTRDAVAAAAQLTLRRPPMLALNGLPAGQPPVPGLYQFALAPEDEARAVARRILADGHRAGIALVPDSEWGRRVLGAFREELTAGGGMLIDAVSYDAEGSDYAGPIMHVLRIDESDARHRRMESILGTKLAFQPRRRADIGFIFAAGPAGAERLLRPQLKFYFAGDLPAYATSDAFEPDPNANQDLDGLIFPDTPWALGGALADGVREIERAAWPAGPRRGVLFAFGFDAWRLSAALRQQPAAQVSVDGLTGHLSFAGDRVQRELQWAQVRDGEARPLMPPEAPAGSPAAPTGAFTPIAPADTPAGSATAPAGTPTPAASPTAVP